MRSRADGFACVRMCKFVFKPNWLLKTALEQNARKMNRWKEDSIINSKWRIGCCAFWEISVFALFLVLTIVGLFALTPLSFGEYALLFHLPHVTSILFNLILTTSNSEELFLFEFTWQTFVIFLDVSAIVFVVRSLFLCFSGISPISCESLVFSNIVAGILSVPMVLISIYIWFQLFRVVRRMWRFSAKEKTS